MWYRRVCSRAVVKVAATATLAPILMGLWGCGDSAAREAGTIAVSPGEEKIGVPQGKAKQAAAKEAPKGRAGANFDR